MRRCSPSSPLEWYELARLRSKMSWSENHSERKRESSHKWRRQTSTCLTRPSVEVHDQALHRRERHRETSRTAGMFEHHERDCRQSCSLLQEGRGPRRCGCAVDGCSVHPSENGGENRPSEMRLSARFCFNFGCLGITAHCLSAM